MSQEPPSIQISVRVTHDVVQTLDQLAAAMSRPGTETTRANALRYVIALGVDAARVELGIKPKKPAK